MSDSTSLRLFGMTLPEVGDADGWNIEELSEEEVLAKAQEPGGIGWMHRVGVITAEVAEELYRRFGHRN